MRTQRSALYGSVIIVTILAALGGPAWAAGGYAGIDGSSTPVPTPTYRMFSGQSNVYVSPTAPTFNRNRVVPPPPRPSTSGQPHK
jgi:hypothetical protein